MTAATPILLPPRQLYPKVRVENESERSHSDLVGQCRLQVRCTQLSDEQAALLNEVLSELPTLMARVGNHRACLARKLMVRTLTKSPTIVEKYRNEARQQAAWQSALLNELPCILVEEAWERCEGTPWEPVADLLWVAHRGRRYFPAQQFTAAGPPDPTWPLLVTKARDMAKCYEWELLTWLLTPHPILAGQSPISAIQSDPKRVVSLAGHTLKESRR